MSIVCSSHDPHLLDLWKNKYWVPLQGPNYALGDLIEASRISVIHMVFNAIVFTMMISSSYIQLMVTHCYPLNEGWGLE